MKQTARLLRVLIGIVSIFGMVASMTAVAAASTGGGNPQSFSATEPLNTGTVVRQDSKNASQVDVASQSDVQNMFGVVVDRSQLLITPSHNAYQNETYVASAGTYDVLVSTQNGPIKAGDYVTLSAVDGVTMKADTSQKTVFGRATQDFDGKSATLGTETVKDKTSGSTLTVTLGMIPVTINIEHNPNIKSTKVDVPQWLQRLGQQIADKQVSPIRIYISLGITGVTLVTALVVIYAGIRNALISIGRNPMSKKSIFRALLEVILTSILILVIGLFAVYLLLKL